MRRVSCLTFFFLLLVSAPARAAWENPLSAPLAPTSLNGTIGDVAATADGTVYATFGTGPSAANYVVNITAVAPGATTPTTFNSPGSATDGDGPKVAVVADVPYVSTNAGGHLVVLRRSGSSFVAVGNPLGSAVKASAIAGVGGVPYVAYVDGLLLNVVRFDGADWVQVGTSLNVNPARQVTHVDIVESAGQPLVAWTEALTGAGDALHAKRYDPDTSSFAAVGDVLNRETDSEAARPSLARSPAGQVWLAWTEATDHTYSFVSRLQTVGTTTLWVPKGDSVNGEAGTANIAITTMGEQPLVVLTDGAIGGVSYTLDASATTWVPGARLDPLAFSLLTSVVDVGGVPWALATPVNLNPQGVDWQLRRLVPDVLDQTAVPGATSAQLVTRMRTYGVPAKIGGELGPTPGFGTALPTVTTHAGDQVDTVSQPIGGLTAGTGYSWRTLFADGGGRTVAGPTAAFTTAAAAGSGPAGPAGPAGAAGPAGPAGAPARLLLALGATKLVGKRGRKVTLRYVITKPAAVQLTVKRGGKTVGKVKATVAAAGRAVISWNGKQGRKKARRGRYTATLLAAAGTETATDAATIRVR